MPAISVIIALYNKEPYLRACLDSVLAQTLRADEYEVIVVDDGSTDAGPAVLAEYVDRGRVRSITQPNAGPSAARNTGLAAATGEFVVFVDADDTVSPHLLAHLLGVHGRTSADVVRAQLVRGHGTAAPTSPAGFTPLAALAGASVELVGSAELYRRLFAGPDLTLMSACATLYPRALLTGHGITFEDDLRHTEDALLNAEVYSLGIPVAISRAVLYRYHEAPHSLGTAYDPELYRAADRLRERLTLFELELGKRGEVARAAAAPLRRYLALYYTLAMAGELTAPVSPNAPVSPTTPHAAAAARPLAERLRHIWTESHAPATFAELDRDGALGPYRTVYALAQAGRWGLLAAVLRAFNLARRVRRALLR